MDVIVALPRYFFRSETLILPAARSIFSWKLIGASLPGNCTWLKQDASSKVIYSLIPMDSLHPTTGWFRSKGPIPLPQLGTSLKGHPSFRVLCKIGWDHCCHSVYHQSTSSISWFSCSHKVLWKWLISKPPNANLRFSICFLRNSTCNVWRELVKLLNFPICCTHMTTKSFAGLLFPSVETLCMDRAWSLVQVQNQ